MRCHCTIDGGCLRTFGISIFIFLLVGISFSHQDCHIGKGLFPFDPSVLWEQVDGFINLIPLRKADCDAVALMLPGENYLAAGSVMGVGYRMLLDQSFDEIIILTSPGSSSSSGVWIPTMARFVTPLGTMPRANRFAEEILSTVPFIRPTGDCPGSDFWYQLPFLQRIFGNHTILPIMVGDVDFNRADSICDAIVSAIGARRVLIIAVSNLSSQSDLTQLSRLDSRSITDICELDYSRLLADVQSGAAELSSLGCVVFAMMLASKLGATDGRLLRHLATSGLPMEKHIGLAAIALCRQNDSENDQKQEIRISPADGEALWKLAAAVILGQPEPKIREELQSLSVGVFLSISNEDSVIARVGDLFNTAGLPNAIKKFASLLILPSPMGNPRPSDVKDAKLSVCIAQPIEGISAPTPDMGIYVKLGNRVGLLLPGEGSNLPPKRRMELACLQAGIPSKSWCIPETYIHFFTVQMFSGNLSDRKR